MTHSINCKMLVGVEEWRPYVRFGITCLHNTPNTPIARGGHCLTCLNDNGNYNGDAFANDLSATKLLLNSPIQEFCCLSLQLELIPDLGTFS